MGFKFITMSLHGTNRRFHGQNTGTLTKLQKSSQNSVPLFLQLAARQKSLYSV